MTTTTTVTTVTTPQAGTTKIPCCPPKIKYIFPPPVLNTTKLPNVLPPVINSKVPITSILTDPSTILTTQPPITTQPPATTTPRPTSTSTTVFCYESNCKKLNF